MNARLLTGAVLTATAVAVAGCGSSSSTNSANATTATTATAAASPGTGSASAGVGQAEAAVAAATSFPTAIPVTESLPAKPPTGKTVVFLQCEQQECNLEGKGIAAAAAAIGWQSKVLNFKAAEPATLVAALNTALQYHPVGVFFSGVPQQVWASVQPAYASAGAFITENFDSVAPSGPGVEPGRGYADNAGQVGKLLADEQAADSGGSGASALLVSIPSYPVFVPEASAYQSEIKATCPTCTVTTFDATLPQLLSGQLVPAVVSAVKRSPGIRYIVAVNATFITQLPAALDAAGLGGRYKIIAGQSQAPDQQNVLDGKELAVVNSPFTMGGWQDVDMAIRKAMNQPIPQGDHVVPTVLLTKGNVGTPKDSYDVPSDYASQFMKIWNVG